MISSGLYRCEPCARIPTMANSFACPKAANASSERRKDWNKDFMNGSKNNIINQPRAAHFGRDRDQGSMCGCCNWKQRVWIDQLDVVHAHLRFFAKNIGGQRLQLFGTSF